MSKSLEVLAYYQGEGYTKLDFGRWLPKAAKSEYVPREWNDESKAMACYMVEKYHLGAKDYDKHIARHLKLGETILSLPAGYKIKLPEMSLEVRKKILDNAQTLSNSDDRDILNALSLQFKDHQLSIIEPAPVAVVEQTSEPAAQAFCQCPAEKLASSSPLPPAPPPHGAPPPAYEDVVLISVVQQGVPPGGNIHHEYASNVVWDQ
ncbi:hypothetical protein [Candidatus Tisiphia endosymbiont of Beris chalybata]|uniref:hypothetical protein n=1 Tax=Candidatus Tisiphia endosymbiont of Beris chalybata TaxID=3066262 RepID=UPI00312C987B